MVRLEGEAVKIPEVSRWRAEDLVTRSVNGTLDWALAEQALFRCMQGPECLRQTPLPCFDRGHGVALTSEVALDHLRVDVERLAAAVAAAVLAGIVRSGAREQTESPATIDESSLTAALQLPGRREGEVLVGIAG